MNKILVTILYVTSFLPLCSMTRKFPPIIGEAQSLWKLQLHEQGDLSFVHKVEKNVVHSNMHNVFPGAQYDTSFFVTPYQCIIIMKGDNNDKLLFLFDVVAQEILHYKTVTQSIDQIISNGLGFFQLKYPTSVDTYSVKNGSIELKNSRGLVGTIESLSHDGQLFFSQYVLNNDSHKYLCAYNVNSDQTTPLFVIDFERSIDYIAFSYNDRFLVIADSYSSSFTIDESEYDFEQDNCPIETFEMNDCYRIRIFEMKGRGTTLCMLHHTFNGICSFQFLPQEEILYITNEDKTRQCIDLKSK